jgi:di/tricarboxylate transporter
LLFMVGILAAAFGLLPTAAAFAGVVVLMLLSGIVRPTEAYDSIDWSVIVLLGAMIPVGEALQTSGAAALIAQQILGIADSAGPRGVLAAVLLLTMMITPVLNNAATVVIMAPIVLSMATTLAIAPDAFLMAVAIGASSNFLTPFGHHNNTIIMGPGGYRFGDYWRVGLGLEVIVFILSLLMLPMIWPF